jgi:hypothetical protein
VIPGEVPAGLREITGTNSIDVTGRFDALGLEQILDDVIARLVDVGVDAVGCQVPGPWW